MLISRDDQIIYGFRNDNHMLGIFTIVNKSHDLTLRIVLEDTFYLKHPGLNRQFIYHRKVPFFSVDLIVSLIPVHTSRMKKIIILGGGANPIPI